MKAQRSDKPLLLDSTFDPQNGADLGSHVVDDRERRTARAKLSDAEFAYLYQWARIEGKRLKAAAGEADAASSGARQFGGQN